MRAVGKHLLSWGGELEMSMRVMRGTNDPDFYLDPGKI